MTKDEQKVYDELVAKGYNSDVADALVNRERTLEWVKLSSPREIFEEFLEWNGIIGYAGGIMSALDNIRQMEGLL